MLPLTYESSPLSILFVDDELSMLLVMEATFQEDGHTVGLATDGVDALRQFHTKRWDVVVTDRSMPGMDGETLAREIKKLSPHTPVIMVTGFVDPRPDRAVDTVLHKPITRAMIAQAITRCLATVDPAPILPRDDLPAAA
ncbi:MAG TPA: response regulator [Chthoniobacteraceae bacterium]|jgi:CheY-like chemotaxis protein|nr:response regulator [Chthoniobacteraceae bacterium]